MTRHILTARNWQGVLLAYGCGFSATEAKASLYAELAELFPGFDAKTFSFSEA